jgi:hypothetical protein
MVIVGWLVLCFVAAMSCACGASVQRIELIREFPEPVADTASDDAVDATVESVDSALRTVTFVVDGYSVPVTPAPVTIFGATTEEEAEAMMAEADIVAMGCERSPIDREAWVCLP